MMSPPLSRCLLTLAFSICTTGALAAPVVVQKGSTAQYIYIPAGSVTAGPSTGTNDGATAAKQFCRRFLPIDTTFTVDPKLMLDDAVKFGAVLIGGGSGSNYSYARTDPDSGLATWIYGSGGGGGSTAVLADGVLIAVAAGGDAVTGERAIGNRGARLTAPEFTARRAGTGTEIKVIIGGGGGSGGPIYSMSTIPDDVNSGTGARGYFGGGAGAKITSSTNLSPLTWTTPARGGSISGGMGAVAPLLGDSRVNGGMGSSLKGGQGSGGGGTRSPNFGRLWYGLRVIGGYYSVRYEYVTPYPIGPEFNAPYWYNSTLTDTAVFNQSVIPGSVEISEANMMSFGAAGPDLNSSGTGGLVMLYYSAPTCNLIP